MLDASQNIALVGVTLFFGVAMYYVLATKIQGFGPLTTALPLFLAALYVGSIAIIFGRLGSNDIANMLFAAIGYGGGLLTARMSAR